MFRPLPEAVPLAGAAANDTRRRRQQPPVAPSRLLGPHHFAYYRGYLQGLDLGRLASRYLTPGLDLRQARTLLGWIEGELVRGVRRLATRPRQDGAAALLNEKAWLAMITAPAAESASARQARQRRLLRGLDALQPLLLARPAAADAVAGWFVPAVATGLAAAGWATLGAVQAAVGADPRGWYRAAPGIGATTAQQIEAWLQAQALGPVALDAPEMPDAGLSPLESLRHGAADGDKRAIEAWLRNYLLESGETSHTWRSYRTQAERFLLWTVFARRKTLPTLTADDCRAYLAFLADPQPAAAWVARRGTPRDRADWRPFEGPLSPTSIRHAAKVLQSLCAWLVREGHLSGNPFATGTPAAKAAQPALADAPADTPAPRIRADRSFTAAQWRHLKQCVAALPADDPRTVRLQCMLRLVYATGLRLSEQAQATVGHLAYADGWTLTVPGTRPRTNALPDTVIDALRAHLDARGLGRDLERLPPETLLIGRILRAEANTPLSVAQLGAIWKRCFQMAGRALQDDDAAGAMQFAQASAHWLRHTAGAHAVARGAARKAVQRQLGHASVSTTAAYATPSNADTGLH